MVENLESEEAIRVSVKTGNEIEELFDSFLDRVYAVDSKPA